MSTTSVFNLEARARRSCIASGGGGGGAPLSAACATLAERGRAALVCEPSPPEKKYVATINGPLAYLRDAVFMKLLLDVRGDKFIGQ